MNSLTAQTQRSVWPIKNPAFAGLFYRGAEIRTRDLTDPNGARYQAAPRPDARGSISQRYRRRMPARLSDIVTELDRLLEPSRFHDYCPNGLQVPGGEEVTTVATGVTAHLELFERARSERAELVLAHHGIFWGPGPGPIDAAMARRLKLLFEANMSLAAYHLPLDAHTELGNNALLARALGATGALEPFADHQGQAIGFIVQLNRDRTTEGDRSATSEPQAPLASEPEGVLASELFARVHELTSREPLVFDAGPQRVRRLAIVSGAGANYLDDAIRAGADAFLTGEPAERVMAQAREARIHFIAAGHYATETFGVKRLGDHLAQRFDLRHVFIDVPNPV
jgi:dinuclear metal center YbgI/SA1388 family protein